MKFKRKYNFIICFMLFVVVLTATMFLYVPTLGEVKSEGSAEIVGETEETLKEESSLTKVKFNNFNTALKHAYRYLETTTGYKSYSSGRFSMNVKNLVNIEQTIKIYSEINNKNNTTHTTLCTYGDGKIKNNIGFEFTTIGDEVSMRKSKDRIQGGINYDNKKVTRYTMEDYLSEWKIMPEEVFVKFSTSKVLNGNLTKGNNKYTLTFTLERGQIIDDGIVFVKRFFDNSKNAQSINPSFYGVSVVMELDEYGRPTQIEYSTSFYDLSLYGVGIPLSGLTGKVSYIQQIYGYGQNIQIQRLPDAVEE